MAGENNPFNYLIDSLWASLPEQTAEDLADCKRKALTWVKDSVGSWVDEEIESLNRHLENARRMREQYKSAEEPTPEAPPNPA